MLVWRARHHSPQAYYRPLLINRGTSGTRDHSHVTLQTTPTIPLAICCANTSASSSLSWHVLGWVGQCCPSLSFSRCCGEVAVGKVTTQRSHTDPLLVKVYILTSTLRMMSGPGTELGRRGIVWPLVRLSMPLAPASC